MMRIILTTTISNQPFVIEMKIIFLSSRRLSYSVYCTAAHTDRLTDIICFNKPNNGTPTTDSCLMKRLSSLLDVTKDEVIEGTFDKDMTTLYVLAFGVKRLVSLIVKF